MDFADFTLYSERVVVSTTEQLSISKIRQIEQLKNIYSEKNELLFRGFQGQKLRLDYKHITN